MQQKLCLIPTLIILMLLGPRVHAENRLNTSTVPQPIATRVAAGQISWQVAVPVEQAHLTVVGDSGEVYSESFHPPQNPHYNFVDTRGVPLPDGKYRYEVIANRLLDPAEETAIRNARQAAEAAWKAVTSAQRATARRDTGHSNQFETRETIAELRDAAVKAEQHVDQLMEHLQLLNGPFAFTSGGTFIMRSAAVESVLPDATRREPTERTLSSTGSGSDVPDIELTDTTDAGDILAGSGLAAGSTSANPSDGELQLWATTPEIAFNSTGTAVDDWTVISGFGGFAIDGTSLSVLELADGAPSRSIYVRSNGNVGLGTATPGENIGISDFNPGILLFDATDSSDASVQLDGGDLEFLGNSAQGIVSLDVEAPANTIVVDPTGEVGIGTAGVLDDLHIADDLPAIRLEDTSSTDPTFVLEILGGQFEIWNPDTGEIPFAIEGPAPQSSLFISQSGDIGVGTSAPNGRFHVTGSDSPRVRMEDTTDNANDKPGLAMKSPASASGGEWRFETDNAGNFQIDYNLSAGPEIVLIDDPVDNSRVKINGELVVQGTCTGCDAVFDSGYPLESIEEHASLMWENSYLPAVGPTPDGETGINVFEKTVGILHELEKAHIYIEQLHDDKERQDMRLATAHRELDELRAENEQLEQKLQRLTKRMSAIESVLATEELEELISRK